MGGLGYKGQEIALDYVVNGQVVSVGTWYLGIGSSANYTGLTGEPSGNGYTRLTVNTDDWNTVVSGTRNITNYSELETSSSTAAWGSSFTAWGLFLTATPGSGDCIAFGSFENAKSILQANTSIRIPAGEIQIDFDDSTGSSGWTDAGVYTIFRYLFKSLTATNNPHWALNDSATTMDDDDNTMPSEIAASGYARFDIGDTAPISQAAGVSTALNKEIDMTANGADFTNVKYVCLTSNSSGGLLYAYIDLGATYTIKDGDSIRLKDQQVTLSLEGT